MQLPRYIKPKSRVSELRSAQQSGISPGEAASAELAKAGAVAAVATSVSDMAGALSEIKQKEELSAAQVSYVSALQGLDEDIREMPLERDSNGIPVYDGEKVRNLERKARKSLANALRENMSGVTRKLWDEFIAESDVQREEEYAVNTFTKETEVLKIKSDLMIQSLIDKGQTELAIAYLDENVGVYGAGGYATKMKEIQKGKSIFRINKAVRSPTVTVSELQVVLEDLENNKWPDGDMNLTSQEVYAAQTRILGKIKDLQDTPSLEAEKASQAAFDTLVPKVLDGEIGVEQLPQYRDVLEEKQYDKLLGYAITERRRPAASQPAILQDYDERASQLVLGYPADEMGFVNWEDEIDDFIHAMSMDEGISQSDYQRIKGTLESAVSKLRKDPELAAMLDVEYEKLTGHTVAQSILGTVPKDKTAQIAGTRLLRDYYREVARLGPEEVHDAMTTWLEKNIPKYHAGVSDGILSKYKIPEVPIRNGTIDYDKLEEMMLSNAVEKARRQVQAGGEYGKLNQAGKDQMMRDAENKAIQDARASFEVYKNQTRAQ